MAEEVKIAGEILFLHLYRTKAESFAFDALHYTQFQKSLKSISPKLESFSTTSISAAQYLYRLYSLQSNPTMGMGTSRQWLTSVWTTLHPAPDKIIKLISCSCKGYCSSAECSCKKCKITCSSLHKIYKDAACFNNTA